ncbi:MAG TPA: hypothetical protein VI485_03115 [Vicinamibacterales bacterium]|nr:hypothetical protein [Vicinamibacterales bacterium]
MRRITVTGSILVAILALAAGSALAQGIAAIRVSEPDEIELTRETRVGSTMLERGRYQLQHQWIEGSHYLIVRAHPTDHGAAQEATGANAVGNEVARVRCRVISTNLRQSGTGMTTRLEVDGSATLTEVRIRDERRGHLLVLQPQM